MRADKRREKLGEVTDAMDRVRTMHDAARAVMGRAPHRHESGTVKVGNERVPKCAHCRVPGNNNQFGEDYDERLLELRKMTQHLPRQQDQAAVRSLREGMERDWKVEASPAVAWSKRAAVVERERIQTIIATLMEPDTATEVYQSVVTDRGGPDAVIHLDLLTLFARQAVAAAVDKMDAIEALAGWRKVSVPLNGDGPQGIVERQCILRELRRHKDGWKGLTFDPTTDTRQATAARELATAIHAHDEARVPSEVREALAECNRIVRWADLQVRGYRLQLPTFDELDAMVPAMKERESD